MSTSPQHTGIIRLRKSRELAEIDEAAKLSGMHPEMVEVFVRAHLVRSNVDENGVPRLNPDGIERLRQIQRLRKQPRPNLRIIRIIVRLTDRLEETERELHNLRNRLSRQ